MLSEEDKLQATLTLLPGDGIGPEVVAEAVKVLKRVEEIYGHRFQTVEALMGGIAIDETGTALPADTLQLCLNSDAVLLGSWRPEMERSSRLGAARAGFTAAA